MPIQWYPGHMTKARRLIAEAIPSQDVILEVLDARMPRASKNPVVTELRRDKPCIEVLTKSDLADPAVTRAWLAHLESGRTAEGRVVAIATSTARAAEARSAIVDLCKRLTRRAAGKTVRAMVVGIPNVGKSTLINTLAGRKVAKVEDRPAVTKARQDVILASGVSLSDNPGILWPKIEDDAGSYRLALGGAIPDVAMDYVEVALFGARFFLDRYPELLRARFKLRELPEAEGELLTEIGRRRGCIRAGGVVDLQRAADILIHEFRSGALGRISLETPDDA
jgi:ribosome biogenesis GTPase A